jgi:hypothetical protein
MESYKITPRKQLLNSWPIFLYAIICIVVVEATVYYKGSDAFNSVTTFMGIAFLSQLLPQFFLHLNYYNINKNDTLNYDKLYKEIDFIHNSKHIKFNLDDIKTATMYKSFALKRKDIQFLTYDSYNHTVIVLHDGTRIVLTSLLMGEDFSLPIPEEKIKVKGNIYRWARGPSLQN